MVKRLRQLLLSSLTCCLLLHSGYCSDGLRSLSHELSRDLNKKHLALGVLNFPYSRGRTSTGSHLVSERLVTYLVQEGQTVIERRFIETMLSEKMLWESGLTDPQSMRRMATILGVDAIVAGTLDDVSDNTTQVMARIIKLDSAEILAAGKITIPRLWSDLPHIPRIAQLSVPVPMSIPQMGAITQRIKVAPAVKSGPQHYQPSPVPVFSIPRSHKIMGGTDR